MCKFQAEIESIERTSGVDFTNKEGRRTKYEYVDLAAALDYVLPKLAKHGLVLTTKSVYRDIVKTETQRKTDGTEVTTSQVTKTIHGIEATVTHAGSKEFLSETVYFDHETKDIKEFGGQITYKRRYAVFNLLCLSAKGEDDDGGNGGQRKDGKPGPGKSPDPERKPAAQKPAAQPPKGGAPAGKEPPKKTDEEIQAEFKELGLDSPEAKEALTSVNIGTMQGAIAFRQKFKSTEEMIEGIMGAQSGS